MIGNKFYQVFSLYSSPYYFNRGGGGRGVERERGREEGLVMINLTHDKLSPRATPTPTGEGDTITLITAVP